MPWKECSVMDERLQFVARRHRSRQSFSAYLRSFLFDAGIVLFAAGIAVTIFLTATR